MIPKGTAAAVLAGLPSQQGIAGGVLIQDLSFGVITISIFLASLLMIIIERLGGKEVPVEPDNVKEDMTAPTDLEEREVD